MIFLSELVTLRYKCSGIKLTLKNGVLPRVPPLFAPSGRGMRAAGRSRRIARRGLEYVSNVEGAAHMKIGIDFGSTYSTVSKYNEFIDNVEAITFSEGDPASIPSVVSISKKGQVTCGKGAKDQAGKKTVRIFEAFKMLLTETDQTMLRLRGYDSTFTPREITKYFLKSILHGVLDRESHLKSTSHGVSGRGSHDRFEDLVICVPEIWSKNVTTLDGRLILRELLKNDIDIPIDHVRIVTEPEAASAFFAYNYEKETGKIFNGHLLLIDYGGGTLDITLTEVSSDGRGAMEIGYREGGGAGENHPDQMGGAIGSAGIAYMQSVVLHAIRDSGAVGPAEIPDYSGPEFVSAVRDLESQLKSSERIRDIEDVFGSFGSFKKMNKILKEEPLEFISLEYEGEEVPVSYQHLFLAYRETIEKVLDDQMREIVPKVESHIGMDPRQPEAGVRDDFKIALVGGFGSFFLVKQQIAEIFKLNPNPNIDLRTKNIAADKREQAISLGAALLAEGKVTLQKTSRYSIGLCSRNEKGAVEKIFYGIKYHQTIQPGRPYFLLKEEGAADVPDNRVVWGALHGNIRSFAIEFTERLNCGGLMDVKPEILERLRQLPEVGFWNCGFSMDENDVVSFHLIPYAISGMPAQSAGIVIQLESYSKMFDLTAVREVTI